MLWRSPLLQNGQTSEIIRPGTREKIGDARLLFSRCWRNHTDIIIIIAGHCHLLRHPASPFRPRYTHSLCNIVREDNWLSATHPRAHQLSVLLYYIRPKQKRHTQFHCCGHLILLRKKGSMILCSLCRRGFSISKVICN